MRGTHSLSVIKNRSLRVEIHFSLLFLLGTLLFAGVVRFGEWAVRSGVSPERVKTGAIGSSVLFTLGVLGFIALHEFAHLWLARKQGAQVSQVTLTMLGGVSLLQRPLDRPRLEFWQALVGPGVSLVSALLLFGISRLSKLPLLSLLTYWWAWANLGLGLFNLLPAFPLDGGRALRSLLSTRNGRTQATQQSVRISKAVAWGIGVIGVLTFNLLLILIAFFIHSSAQNELFALLSQGLLRGLRVSEVCLRAPAASERDTLLQVAEHMLNSRRTTLPVETLSGEPALVSFQRIRRVPRAFWETTKVKDVLDPAPGFLDSRDPLPSVVTQLGRAPLRALPVKEEGRWVGVLRYSEVAEILEFRGLGDDHSEAA